MQVESELDRSQQARGDLEEQLQAALRRAERAEGDAAGVRPLQSQLIDAQAGLQSRAQRAAEAHEQLAVVKAQLAKAHVALQQARDEKDASVQEATALRETVQVLPCSQLDATSGWCLFTARKRHPQARTRWR